MAETRITVQEVEFEAHRARVEAVYDMDAAGRYHFVRFEITERRRPGRPAAISQLIKSRLSVKPVRRKRRRRTSAKMAAKAEA
jgi:hypothetical protein